MGAEVSLSSLGEVGVKRSCENTKSDGGENEEGEVELLSSASSWRSTCLRSVKNNLSVLVVVSVVNRRDEVTDKVFLDVLVVVFFVIFPVVVESKFGFTLGSSFVQLFAHPVDFTLIAPRVIINLTLIIPRAGEIWVNAHAAPGAWKCAVWTEAPWRWWRW